MEEYLTKSGVPDDVIVELKDMLEVIYIQEYVDIFLLWFVVENC